MSNGSVYLSDFESQQSVVLNRTYNIKKLRLVNWDVNQATASTNLYNLVRFNNQPNPNNLIDGTRVIPYTSHILASASGRMQGSLDESGQYDSVHHEAIPTGFLSISILRGSTNYIELNQSLSPDVLCITIELTE